MAHEIGVKIRKLDDRAIIPTYAHAGDAGFDLVAIEDVMISPGDTAKVATGLAFEIPLGYEMQIRPRSGVTSKTKLRVQLGTVDSTYRGEVSVLVDNANTPVNVIDAATHQEALNRQCVIERGTRIAQAVIAPVAAAVFSEVDELSDSERGERGFGSSGTR